MTETAIVGANQTPESTEFSAVKRLLKELDVRRIISVDDDYAPSIEKIVEILVAEVLNISEIAELKGLDLSNPPEVKKVEINKRLNAVDPARIEIIYNTVSKQRPGGTDSGTGALEEICKKLELGFEKHCLKSWREKYNDLAVLGSTGRDIVLFDQSFTEERESDDAGISEIKRLLEKTTSNKVLAGLLTNTCEPGHEHIKWEQVSKERTIDRSRFLYISKARLEGDADGFALMLKLTVLSPRCHELLEMVSKAATESLQVAAERFKHDVTIYDFAHIVFVLTREEGAWEPDTLLRILQIFHRGEVTKKLRGTPELNNFVEKVREVVQIDIKNGSATKHLSWKIQHAEMYDQGEYINGLHLPIELGDVFKRKLEDGTEKYYVLIAQPCDLMVRSGGKRGGRCAEEAVLCEMFSGSKSDHDFELKYWSESDGTSAWVTPAARTTVALYMLDLAVFSAQGQTSMKTTDTMPSGLLPTWADRFALLQKRIASALKNHAAFKSKGLADDLARSAIPNVTLDGKFKPLIAATSLDFGLTRVRRVRYPWSSSLLKEYSLHYAREAFDMDLGREIGT